MPARVVAIIATVTVAVAVDGATSAADAPRAAGVAPTSVMRHCALPSSGGFATATLAQEALDPAAVSQAVAYASTHLRTSVQIFRNYCRVATGPLDPVTDRLPWNVWSSTKSVVSMLTGIAADQHKLALDDPIGMYLPTGPGWGDAAHRAITIRELLTETAGLQEAIGSEAATIGIDPNIAQEALAQPLTHTPGTHFEYSQRDPDLLAYVVQRAVGMDLQTFAQRNLFGPLGIPRSSYFWLRDRSGDTYGYAYLFIPPAQFAKLGLLMQSNGAWNGRQIISARYVHQVAQPTPTNGCYGLLFWTNAGQPCTSANIPDAQTVHHSMIPSAPADLYAMVGAFQQNTFIIPSLHMTVTWTGMLGDTTPNLPGLLSASPAASDLYYTFFRILMHGVQDRHIPDPGPYTAPPQDFDVNPTHYADPRVLLHDLAANPHCNLLLCDSTIPTQGLAQNGHAITRTLLASITTPH
ncbi:MAG: serine hydrolase domain-containing protein [Pseudonocardiaceae bacterium]